VIAPLLPDTPLLGIAAARVVNIEEGAMPMPRPRTVERVSRLGVALQQLRAELHLSKESLGAELGLSGMTIHRYELARTTPSAQVMLHLRRLVIRQDVLEVVRTHPELRKALVRAALLSPAEK
jgi:DNA-binding XRE family transcriptional regulator